MALGHDCTRAVWVWVSWEWQLCSGTAWNNWPKCECGLRMGTFTRVLVADTIIWAKTDNTDVQWRYVVLNRHRNTSSKPLHALKYKKKPALTDYRKSHHIIYELCQHTALCWDQMLTLYGTFYKLQTHWEMLFSQPLITQNFSQKFNLTFNNVLYYSAGSWLGAGL